jgi:hypothetical protein
MIQGLLVLLRLTTPVNPTDVLNGAGPPTTITPLRAPCFGDGVANQFPVSSLPPNPQLQPFPRFVDFVSVYPIPRPTQYFAPVRLSHPAECIQNPQKSNAHSIRGVTVSRSEPKKDAERGGHPFSM